MLSLKGRAAPSCPDGPSGGVSMSTEGSLPDIQRFMLLPGCPDREKH